MAGGIARRVGFTFRGYRAGVIGHDISPVQKMKKDRVVLDHGGSRQSGPLHPKK
jgi:hypothetical protein